MNDVQEWRERLREGRLSEALAAQLSAPHPDESALRLLEGLTELRGLLRAKAWRKARGLAERLGDDMLPRLAAEVAQLEASGVGLERGDAEQTLMLLEGVELALLCAEVETQRGTAYVFLGDAEAAERSFKKAVELDPKHYRAVTNLGNVALEQGRVDDAITFYEEALKLNEGFSNAHHNLGVAYRRKGQVNRSVASIRRAQRVSRQSERDEARGVLKSFGRGQRSPYLKWLLYAVVAAGGFLLLKAQGVL